MADSSSAPTAPVAQLLKRRTVWSWLNGQRLIRFFFGSNASITIAVLVLIMFFLLREGSMFFPTYQRELQIYRQAGLEYCDLVNKPLSEHGALLSRLNRAFMAEVALTAGVDVTRRNEALLLSQQLAEQTRHPRLLVEDAIAKPGSPEEIEAARQRLRQASQAAADKLTISSAFSPEEQKTLRAALATIQPDDQTPPAFVQNLVTVAATKDAQARQTHTGFQDAIDVFEEALEPVEELHDSMKEIALAIKAEAVQLHMAEDAIAMLRTAAAAAKTPEERDRLNQEAAATSTQAIDFTARVQPLKEKLPEYEKLIAEYVPKIQSAAAQLPKEAQSKPAVAQLKQFRVDFEKHLQHVRQSIEQMRGWDSAKPVPLTQALVAFVFGGDWITNSTWQDFYGVVPLFTGSLLISLTALLLAVPFSVAAAIYTNQIASPWEQEIIKPVIEFIQAIPSVVFGFIGISVVGDGLREISDLPFLQWIPGFPIAERLNMFNAGCLLALMAVPTMFSLAEDALQNVPQAYAEASESLGASKMQTIFRVIIPAALSGIFAAILLGFGRIVGETMVVLLVAGNRIAIPDFSDGVGVVFQPAHTLTGIIAQELGEVSRGSSHWQALFMVGILLFAISLGINFGARQIVKRFKIASA